MIASLIPRAGVGNKFPLVLSAEGEARKHAALYANLCSFVLDYAARQKLGGVSLSYFHAKQFPILAPTSYDREAAWSKGHQILDWVLPRVLELTYSAWNLVPFARDCGYDGPPFRWDTARRFLLRCELDAAFFHLYGLGRDDAAYVLDSFPVVRKRDEAQHGEYRTARVILEVYDRIADAARTGFPYTTLLDPPPADPRVAHPRRHAAGTPTRTQVQRGRVSFYILLLLRAWNKPVSREVLDASIVLMLNDGARRAILGQRLSVRQRDRLGRPPVTIGGLDRLLEAMLGSRAIETVTRQGQQAFQFGSGALTKDEAPTDDAERVKETLKAIEELGLERVRLELEEVVDESFELVS